MLFFANIVLLLNIHDLDLEIKNYNIFEYQISSVFSFGFLRDFLPLENRSIINSFNYKNDDLSELVFYKITYEQNLLKEKYIHMIENSKDITFKRFSIKLNEFCDIINVNPEFKWGQMDDNYQKLDVENITNYSKYIWENFLANIINYNKLSIKNIINEILSQPFLSIESMLEKYPLLYFHNKFDELANIFSVISQLIIDKDIVEYDMIYNSLIIFCENEDENISMQRYHIINGPETNDQSKNFFLSCLLTDIKNTFNFFENNHQCVFEIYNFIECRNIVYSAPYVACIVNLDIRKVKKENQNRYFIFIYDNNNNLIEKFIITRSGNKFVILLEKILCLNKNINNIKIIIHTDEKIYESRDIELSENFTIE